MKVIPFRPDLKQEYKNPFKEKGFYPFTEITRVLADSDTGEILTELNELDSRFTKEGVLYNLDELKHGIFLKIPPFYCKRNWKGEVLEDSFIAEVPPQTISEIPSWITNLNFEVWPSFVRPDGSIRPYILYGCFKGSEVNGKLMSLPYKQPVVSKTITQMRALARTGRTEKFNIETFGTVAMMQFLYKIAFQDLNSQAVIGNGWTNKSAANKTGSTMALGNRTGFGTTDWGVADGYDAPDPRICFIMGVQDGKFKYWSKDPNIKPEGIDSAINQFDNGVVTSETGEFACKVNENSIYTGGNFLNYFEIGAARGPGNMIKSSNAAGETIIECRTGKTVAGMPFGVGSNTNPQCEVGDYVSGECEILLEEWNHPTIKLMINNGSASAKALILDTWVKISFECVQITESNKSNSLEFFVGRNGVEEIDFSINPLKFKVRNGFISKIKSLKYKLNKTMPINSNICINLPSSSDTHSFIIKKYNDLKKTSADRWVLYRNETGEDARFWTTEQIIDRDVIVSKNYNTQGISKRNQNVSYSKLWINSRTNLSNASLSDSFELFICYEGNLTEQELKAELAKNLKIPDLQCTQQLPNYKGEDQGYYGKYNNTNTDFPLVKPAIYRIKDSNGLLYLAKIENDDTVKGDKIQILSGKVRVKGITAPFELSIIPSFPFETTNGYQAPDKSCVGAIMADSTGLKSWFSEPGTKIKGIENARIVEETEDYMIICDGTTVTIDNYVVGTYDLYNETLANVEKTKSYAGIPMVIGATEPTIDHEALLNKINKEQLTKLVTKPTVPKIQPTSFVVTDKHNYSFEENWKHIKINEEIQIHYEDNGVLIEEYELTTPNTDLVKIDGHKVIGLKAGTAVISTEVASFCLIIDPEVYVNPKPEPEPTPVPVPMPKFPARTIPIPVDLCCRIDKKTGEIGTNEGYENVSANIDFFNNPRSMCRKINEYTYEIIKDSSNDIPIMEAYLLGQFSNYVGKISLNFISTKKIATYSTMFSNLNKWEARDKIQSSSDLNNFTSYPLALKHHNTYTESYVGTIFNFMLTKTKNPKPFIKNQIPKSKISILTNATSQTHSLFFKQFSTKTFNGADLNWQYTYICGEHGEEKENLGFHENITGDLKYSDRMTTKNGVYVLRPDSTIWNSKNFLGSPGLTSGFINLTRYYSHSEGFKQFFIYKNNFTEQEFIQENNKNIDINYNPHFKTIAKDGLICWLDGRDGSGNQTIWNDRSGNNNSAQLYNFKFDSTSGWTGKSLKLDGLNNYLKINNNKIKYIEIIYKNGKNGCYLFELRPVSSNGYFVLQDNYCQINNINLIENKNYTFDSKNNKPNKFTSLGVEIINLENQTHLTIGGGGVHGVDTGFNNIEIASIKIYDRALTDAEIQQNYEYELSINRGE